MYKLQNFSWQKLLIVTILTSFLYIFMEWVFFVTKPSFMSGTTVISTLNVFFVTSGILVFFSFILVNVFFLLGIFLARVKIVADIMLYLAASVPSALMAILALILLDNFTYTVFKFGVVSLPDFLRGVYALGFVFLIFYFVGWSLRFICDSNLKTQKHLLITTGILSFFSFLCALGQFQLPPQLEIGSAKTAMLPNILVFGSDGINAANMSIYGYERETTPNLQKLSPEFLVAENAFTNGDFTKVSTISILTGKLPSQTKVISSSNILLGLDAYQHLPGILRGLGYYNVQFGVPQHVDAFAANLQFGFVVVNGRSYNKNPVFQAARIMGLGEASYFFSVIFERASTRILHIFYIQKMINPMDVVTMPDEYAGVSDQEKISQLIDLVKNTQSPVFVHAHLMGTHGPQFNPVHRVFSLNKEQSEGWMGDFYDDTILDFDSYIQEIVDGLSRVGELDNTVLVIYTDHNMKYRTDLKIPLMIRFPNGEFAGRVSNNTQNIDIAPVLLDYLGVEKPGWMSGESFLRSDPPQDRLIMSGDGVKTIRVIQCNRLYKVFIDNRIWFTGEVAAHTHPCAHLNITSKVDLPDDIKNILAETGVDLREHPDNNDFYSSYIVTRRQISSLLLFKKYGASYVPPAAENIFSDVAISDPDIDLIEQIYREGIIDSCSAFPLSFCPDQAITSEELAVIILKTLEGSDYEPPSAKGVFIDVPVDSSFAPWIEELYARHIVDGCRVDVIAFCPSEKLFGEHLGLFINRVFPQP